MESDICLQCRHLCCDFCERVLAPALGCPALDHRKVVVQNPKGAPQGSLALQAGEFAVPSWAAGTEQERLRRAVSRKPDV